LKKSTAEECGKCQGGFHGVDFKDNEKKALKFWPHSDFYIYGLTLGNTYNIEIKKPLPRNATRVYIPNY